MMRHHLFSWKTVFYRGLLPVLRRLGPLKADSALTRLGRLVVGRHDRRDLEVALSRARTALGADWDLSATRSQLASNVPRLLARDTLLDGLTDDEALARFDVSGFEHVEHAIHGGGGLILLGSHFGAHLPALHWLDRRGVPFRMLVQRPKHLSRRLHARFDAEDPRFPQRNFDLRRGMPPAAAARCVLLARDALRAGLAVYLNGDIPFDSPNARPGRFLGRAGTYLALWGDLAVLARVPVVPVFCTHLPAGRFRLRFGPRWTIPSGSQQEAFERFLALLESEIHQRPSEALVHLRRRN